MSTLGLKPLTKEYIQEMGIPGHELWVVKIGEESFGPFDTDSLREYAALHEELFDDALASRLENNNLLPFFGHAPFQRRTPQIVKDKQHTGPYWIIEQGLKTGPASKEDIQFKVQEGILGMTDLISTDDGHTWCKIFELKAFDRRSRSSSEPPVSPGEASFIESSIEFIDRENRSSIINMTEELASVAHGAKSKSHGLRLDEVPLHGEDDIPISHSMKYAFPVFLMVIMAVVGSGKYFMTQDEILPTPTPPKAVVTANREIQKKSLPRKSQMPIRRPASTARKSTQTNNPVRPATRVTPPSDTRNRFATQARARVQEQARIRAQAQARARAKAKVQARTSSLTRVPNKARVRPKKIVKQQQSYGNPYAEESQYPTTMETHPNDRYPAANEPDPYGPTPEVEYNDRPEEHSLIGNPAEREEARTLDEVMEAGTVVEEISDF